MTTHDALFMFKDKKWKENTPLQLQYAAFATALKNDPGWKKMPPEVKAKVYKQNFGFESPFELINNPEFEFDSFDVEQRERIFDAVTINDDNWHNLGDEEKRLIKGKKIPEVGQRFLEAEAAGVQEPVELPKDEQGRIEVQPNVPHRPQIDGQYVVPPLQRPDDYSDQPIKASPPEGEGMYFPEVSNQLPPEVVEDIVNAPESVRPYLESEFGDKPFVSQREYDQSLRAMAMEQPDAPLPHGNINIGSPKDPVILSGSRIEVGTQRGVIEITPEEGERMFNRGVIRHHVETPNGVVMLRDPSKLSEEELAKARELDYVRPELMKNPAVAAYMKFNQGAGIDDVLNWAASKGEQVIDNKTLAGLAEFGITSQEQAIKMLAKKGHREAMMDQITGAPLSPEFHGLSRASQVKFIMDRVPLESEEDKREFTKKFMEQFVDPVKKDFDSLPDHLRPEYPKDPMERGVELRKHPYWNSLKAGTGDLLMAVGGAMWLTGDAMVQGGKEEGMELIEKGKEISDKYTDTEVEADLGQQLLRTAPVSVPLMVPAAVVSAATGGALLPVAIAAAGSGIAESFMEGGSTAAESLLAGDQEAVARSKGIRVTRDNLIYQAGMSIPEAYAAFVPTAKLTEAAAKLPGLRNIKMTPKMTEAWNTMGRVGVTKALDTAGRIALDTTSEYAEEWLQTFFQQAADQDKDTFSWDSIANATNAEMEERHGAGVVGAHFGGGMAVAGQPVQAVATYFSKEGTANRIQKKLFESEVNRLAEKFDAKPSEIRADIEAAYRTEGLMDEANTEVEVLSKELNIEEDEVRADLDGARSAAWGSHEQEDVTMLSQMFGVPEYFVRQNWDEVNAAAGRGALDEDTKTPASPEEAALEPGTTSVPAGVSAEVATSFDGIPDAHKGLIVDRATQVANMRIKAKMDQYGLDEKTADQFPENEREQIVKDSFEQVWRIYADSEPGRAALGKGESQKPTKPPTKAEEPKATPTTQKGTAKSTAPSVKLVPQWKEDVNNATTREELDEVEKQWQESDRASSVGVRKAIDARRKTLETEAAAEIGLDEFDYDTTGQKGTIGGVNDGSFVRVTTEDGRLVEGRVRAEVGEEGLIAIDDGNKLEYFDPETEVDILVRKQKPAPRVPPKTKRKKGKYYGDPDLEMEIFDYANDFELANAEKPDAQELYEYMNEEGVDIELEEVRDALENEPFLGRTALGWVQAFEKFSDQGITATRLKDFINSSAALKGNKKIDAAMARYLMSIADVTPVQDVDAKAGEDEQLDVEEPTIPTAPPRRRKSDQAQDKTDAIESILREDAEKAGIPKDVVDRVVKKIRAGEEVTKVMQEEKVRANFRGPAVEQAQFLEKAVAEQDALERMLRDPFEIGKTPARRKGEAEVVAQTEAEEAAPISQEAKDKIADALDGTTKPDEDVKKYGPIKMNKNGTTSARSMKDQIRKADTIQRLDDLEAIEREQVVDGLMDKPRASIITAIENRRKEMAGDSVPTKPEPEKAGEVVEFPGRDEEWAEFLKNGRLLAKSKKTNEQKTGTVVLDSSETRDGAVDMVKGIVGGKGSLADEMTKISKRNGQHIIFNLQVSENPDTGLFEVLGHYTLTQSPPKIKIANSTYGRDIKNIEKSKSIKRAAVLEVQERTAASAAVAEQVGRVAERADATGVFVGVVLEGKDGKMIANFFDVNGKDLGAVSFSNGTKEYAELKNILDKKSGENVVAVEFSKPESEKNKGRPTKPEAKAATKKAKAKKKTTQPKKDQIEQARAELEVARSEVQRLRDEGVNVFDDEMRAAMDALDDADDRLATLQSKEDGQSPKDPAKRPDKKQEKSTKTKTNDSVRPDSTPSLRRDKNGAVFVEDLLNIINSADNMEVVMAALEVYKADLKNGRRKKASRKITKMAERKMDELAASEMDAEEISTRDFAFDKNRGNEEIDYIYVDNGAGGKSLVRVVGQVKKAESEAEGEVVETDEEASARMADVMAAEWPWVSQTEEQNEAYEYLDSLEGDAQAAEIFDVITTRWKSTNMIDDMIDPTFVNQVLNEMEEQAPSVAGNRQLVVDAIRNEELLDDARTMRMFLFQEYPGATTLRNATGEPISSKLSRLPRRAFEDYLELESDRVEDEARGTTAEQAQKDMRSKPGFQGKPKRPHPEHVKQAVLMKDIELGTIQTLIENGHVDNDSLKRAINEEIERRKKEDPKRKFPSTMEEVEAYLGAVADAAGMEMADLVRKVVSLADINERSKAARSERQEEVKVEKAEEEDEVAPEDIDAEEERLAMLRDLDNMGFFELASGEIAHPGFPKKLGGESGKEMITKRALENLGPGTEVEEIPGGFRITVQSDNGPVPLDILVTSTDRAILRMLEELTQGELLVLARNLERHLTRQGERGENILPTARGSINTTAKLIAAIRTAMIFVDVQKGRGNLEIPPISAGRYDADPVTGRHLVEIISGLAFRESGYHEVGHWWLRNFVSDETFLKIINEHGSEEDAVNAIAVALSSAADAKDLKRKEMGTVGRIASDIKEFAIKLWNTIFKKGSVDPNEIAKLWADPTLDNIVELFQRGEAFKKMYPMISREMPSTLTPAGVQSRLHDIWGTLPRNKDVLRGETDKPGLVLSGGPRVDSNPLKIVPVRYALRSYSEGDIDAGRKILLQSKLTKQAHEVSIVPATQYLQDMVAQANRASDVHDYGDVTHVVFVREPRFGDMWIPVQFVNASSTAAARQQVTDMWESGEDSFFWVGNSVGRGRIGFNLAGRNPEDSRQLDDLARVIDLHLPEDVSEAQLPLEQDAAARQGGTQRQMEQPSFLDRMKAHRFRGMKSWLNANLKPARGLDKELYLTLIDRRRGAMKGKVMGKAANQRVRKIIKQLKDKFGEERINNTLSMVLDGRMPVDQFKRIYGLKNDNPEMVELQKILDESARLRAELSASPNIPQKLRDLILSNEFYQTRMYAIHALGNGYVAPQDAYQAAVDAVFDMHEEEINRLITRANKTIGRREVFDLPGYMQAPVAQRQQMLQGLSRTKKAAIENLAKAMDPWMEVIDSLELRDGNLIAQWSQESLSSMAADTVEGYLSSSANKGKSVPGPIGGMPITHQMKRKLDETFRELYGEITSPGERLSRTMEVQHDLLAASVMFQKIFEEGEGKWWSRAKRGNFSERLASGRGITPADRRKYGNMAGMYVTQETYDLLHGEGTFDQITEGFAPTRWFNQLQAVTRATRLIWPKTILRNGFTSVTGFAARSGDIFNKNWLKHMKDGTALAARVGRAIMADEGWAPGKQGDPEALEILADLVAKDVFDFSQDSILTAIDANIKITAESKKGSPMRILRESMMLYALIDLPAKYASYYSMRDEGASHEEAVQHVRDHYQYRDYVPLGVSKINRASFGDYFGYTFDSTRTWINSMNRAAREAKKGNLRPLMGFMLSATIPIFRFGSGGWLAAASPKLYTSIVHATASLGNLLTALGMKDDDDDDTWKIATDEQVAALRESLPSYDRYQPLAVWYEKNEDGDWNLKWYVMGNLSAFPIEDVIIGAWQASNQNTELSFIDALIHNTSQASPFSWGMTVENVVKATTGYDMSSGWSQPGLWDVYDSFRDSKDGTAIRPDAGEIVANRLFDFVSESFAPGQTGNTIRTASEVIQGREPRLGRFVRRKKFSDVVDIFARLQRSYDAAPEDQARLLDKMTRNNFENLEIAKRMAGTAGRKELEWKDGAVRSELLRTERGQRAWHRALLNIQKKVQNFRVLTNGNFSDQEIKDMLRSFGTIRAAEADHIVRGTVEQMTASEFEIKSRPLPTQRGDDKVLEYFEQTKGGQVLYKPLWESMKEQGYAVGELKSFRTRAKKLRKDWMKQQ